MKELEAIMRRISKRNARRDPVGTYLWAVLAIWAVCVLFGCYWSMR